jgi:hypothetical protein
MGDGPFSDYLYQKFPNEKWCNIKSQSIYTIKINKFLEGLGSKKIVFLLF